MAFHIEVEVELSPVFQTICSAKHLSVKLREDETTGKALLRHLSSVYGEKMEALLFEKGEDEVISGLMVMINDRIFTGNALNQKDIPLQDRDKVNLLYFVSGG
ncbi:MAG: MoaD/ThiS family protein [Thermodesulfobacteriota bacterium]|nr:MoaD/ThiS family protein [Thermodesulfobacteriota bacterium]